MEKPRFDQSVITMQGGGALGAYQAGVYEGLAEAGILPTWIVGNSIGAINGTIIAGNPPERRVEQLRKFWDLVSSYAPFIPPPWFDTIQPMISRLSGAWVLLFGVPGFFVPRFPPPLFATDKNRTALSIYDTTPLKHTLEELVDFDLINSRKVRLSLGSVNIKEGLAVYFDNDRTRIGPEHVLASSSLPPSFPPVTIDGKQYWDGSIIYTSPLIYVANQNSDSNILIIEIDFFNEKGDLPNDLDQARERAKDIQFASKRRLTHDHVIELSQMSDALKRLLSKLPPELRNDPDAGKLTPLFKEKDYTLLRMVNPRTANISDTKKYDFSRASINKWWAAGLEDVRRSAARIDLIKAAELGPGMRVYDLPSSAAEPDVKN